MSEIGAQYSIVRPYMLFVVVMDTDECRHPVTIAPKNVVGRDRSWIIQQLEQKTPVSKAFLGQQTLNPMSKGAVASGR
jgi:hypothetical protein